MTKSFVTQLHFSKSIHPLSVVASPSHLTKTVHEYYSRLHTSLTPNSFNLSSQHYTRDNSSGLNMKQTIGEQSGTAADKKMSSWVKCGTNKMLPQKGQLTMPLKDEQPSVDAAATTVGTR